MKPINMKTWEVQAVLANRKTVTRRVVKFKKGQNPQWTGYIPDGNVLYGSNNIPAVKSPYRPGEILYVRETWAQNANEGWFYKADGKNEVFSWKPSIHMPQVAARIFLRVTDVRVERLQDIFDEQAEKVGCNGEFIGTGEAMGSGWAVSPTEEFAELWDITLKPQDRALYGWQANPWVWVVAFEKVSREEAEICPKGK